MEEYDTSIRAFQGKGTTLASTSRNITSENSSTGKPSFLSKIMHNKNMTNLTLEEVVDIDKDIQVI